MRNGKQRIDLRLGSSSEDDGANLRFLFDSAHGGALAGDDGHGGGNAGCRIDGEARKHDGSRARLGARQEKSATAGDRGRATDAPATIAMGAVQERGLAFSFELGHGSGFSS